MQKEKPKEWGSSNAVSINYSSMLMCSKPQITVSLATKVEDLCSASKLGKLFQLFISTLHLTIIMLSVQVTCSKYYEPNITREINTHNEMGLLINVVKQMYVYTLVYPTILFADR